MIERKIAAGTHGRYLVSLAAARGAPILAGFHGYGENAEVQIERLRAIEGIESWTAVAIQGLHRFYERRTQRVVASWMTREDRELAIADNIAYAANCIRAVCAELDAAPRAVFAGFSQGAAMAFRTAAHAECEIMGVIAAGGDIPPELTRAELSRIPAVLLCRGKSDEWYTATKFAEDEARLRELPVAVTALECEGGHEWNPEIIRAASGFLAGLVSAGRARPPRLAKEPRS